MIYQKHALLSSSGISKSEARSLIFSMNLSVFLTVFRTREILAARACRWVLNNNWTKEDRVGLALEGGNACTERIAMLHPAGMCVCTSMEPALISIPHERVCMPFIFHSARKMAPLVSPSQPCSSALAKPSWSTRPFACLCLSQSNKEATKKLCYFFIALALA